MKVAIYVRTSPEDLELVIDAQLSTCRTYCRRMRWSIYRDYVDLTEVDDISGRAAWQELIGDAEHRMFDVVLMTKLDVAFCSVAMVHETYTLLAPLGVSVRVSKFNLDIGEDNPSGLNLLSGLAELDYEVTFSHRK